MKTKEEQQEEKRIAMSIRIKTMDLDGGDTSFLVSLKINISLHRIGEGRSKIEGY